jgi:uncharacterized protein YhfF
MTEVGKRTVMLDGAGRPCAVLVTLELVQRRFEVNFAHWRQSHRDYFSQKNRFTEDMLLLRAVSSGRDDCRCRRPVSE